ncbi:MAG TPA: methyltransferase domain-containing protein [Thermoanaerobaculia bacterium]|nr:methyltransferase domain-containing protein [Thermoanaerobaculia bacterium]
MRDALVNLGCGTRFREGWFNIDIEPASPEVMRHDLSRGIPLPDGGCRAVYHSHLLEHLRREDAVALLKECHRVLQPGGVIRIATPDLERICRDYLAALERHAKHDAEWMRIELLDQMVRERSGGLMAAWFARDTIPNTDFVEKRIGCEAEAIQRAVRARHGRRWPGWARAARYGLHLARRIAVATVAGRSGLRAYDVGRFRLSGEVHQWLYERVSLAALLRATGFADPVVQTASGSRIEGWDAYHLDTLPDGTVVKPDSLFMEAVRPPV